MNDFYINTVLTVVTSALGFLFGIINTKHLLNKKNYEEQLNRVFSPIYKELSTFGIDYVDTKVLVDKIYRIAYENHQYVPSELMKNIIKLKEYTLENENLNIHETDEFKFINYFVSSGYVKLQQVLRKNQSINELGLKRYVMFIDKISDLCFIINISMWPAMMLNEHFQFVSPPIFLFVVLVNAAFLFVTIFLKNNISKKELKESELRRQWMK